MQYFIKLWDRNDKEVYFRLTPKGGEESEQANDSSGQGVTQEAQRSVRHKRQGGGYFNHLLNAICAW